jgi:hypothetical protein
MPAPRSTLAPTTPPTQEPTGAGDDDALALLVSQGVTPRIAQELVAHRSAEAIRQQIAWQPYRPKAKSPAGALVQAIRDAWPPPAAWVEAQERAAAVARQAEAERRRHEEEDARRREWESKPPEERVQGRVLYWIQTQRLKTGREPSPGEVAAKRAELLAGLVAAAAGGGR